MSNYDKVIEEARLTDEERDSIMHNPEQWRGGYIPTLLKVQIQKLLSHPLVHVEAENQEVECSIDRFSWCDYTPEDAYAVARKDMSGFIRVEPKVKE